MTQVTVLAYHAVGTCPREHDPHGLWVSAAAFERQLSYLSSRRRVVPLADVVRGRVARGRPAVAITFDDAYRSVLDEAVPRLEGLGLPATVFAPTAFLGDRNRWDEPTGCELPIMSPDELLSLEARGISVESHGHAHRLLEHASGSDAEEDLSASWAALSELLGRPPRYLAYPFSTGSEAARRAARGLGFEAAFSIDRRDDGPFARGRVPVTPLDGPRLFALKTSGRYLDLRHNGATTTAWPLVGRGLRAARQAVRSGAGR
jgi:peptidoglycan/xylan/chitin deacetylase (PgdA/CDA1 family)